MGLLSISNLMHEAISDIDPEFYYVYDWFSAVYINSHIPGATTEDLHLVSDFLEVGMTHFPTDYRLPYTAGLLYIGYSKGRSDEERAKEYERGAYFLEKCLAISTCPPYIPLTMAHFRSKQRSLQNVGEEDEEAATREEIELFKALYLQASDEELQSKLAQLLQTKGVDVATLDTSKKERLKAHYDSERSYLPLNLWTNIVYPQPPLDSSLPHGTE